MVQIMDSDEGLGAWGGSIPTVWVLLDDRPGNSTQSMGLVECLTWPYEVKNLTFVRSSYKAKSWYSPPDIEHVNKPGSSPLTPPWPDLIIAAGQRTAPISKWIKAQSHQKTKIVHLGRKGGLVMDDFDLVVTPRSSQLPPHPNRLEVTVPLNRVTSEKLLRAANQGPEVLSDSSRLRIVLLVGGATPRYQFDPDAAERMGKGVGRFAQEHKGKVFALTSRRTGTRAADALEAGLRSSGEVYRWNSDHITLPYLSALSLADVIIVTGESESMIAEVAATDSPMFIYPLSKRPQTVWQKANILKRWIFRQSCLSQQEGQTEKDPNALLPRVCTWFFARGWLQPWRNLEALHEELFSMKVAQPFGASLLLQKRPPLNECPKVAERIKSMLRKNSES
jgi:mitochondrial fission protein ELM1